MFHTLGTKFQNPAGIGAGFTTISKIAMTSMTILLIGSNKRNKKAR
jgi:hypothetical protein